LVLGIDVKDVETNALCFTGLIQQTIALSFLERRRDRIFVELFQFAHIFAELNG
jgi:hypothetical protein